MSEPGSTIDSENTPTSGLSAQQSFWVRVGAWLMQHAAWIVLLLALLATFLVWKGAHEALSQAQQAQFKNRTEEMTNAVLKRMHVYEQVLRGGVGLFAASESVSRAAWKEYVASLKIQEHYPGIQGIAFSAHIPAARLDAHLRAIRAEGFPDYAIRPAGVRAEYTSIIYHEPFDWRNQRTIGFDMLTEANRRAAMERARDTGGTAISAKVTLVQEDGKAVQPGMVMYLPHYKNGAPHNTLAERRANLVGYVASPFRLNDLMSGILGKYQTDAEPDIDIEVYDGTQHSADSLLYDEDKIVHALGKPPAGSLTLTKHIDLYGHTWSLYFTTRPAFHATFDQNKPLLFLLVGTLLSVMLSGLVLVFATQRRHALALASDMTQSLRDSEEHLRTIIDTNPECIKILDADGRLIDMNAAGLAMIEADSLNQVISAPMPSLLLPEHREAFQALTKSVIQGNKGTLVFEIQGLKGTRRWLETHAVPMTLRTGETVLLGITRDITERRKSEELLAISRKQFMTLIDNVPGVIYRCANDSDWTMEFISDYIKRITGYPASDFINGAVRSYASIIHPLDVKLVDSSIQEGIREKRPYDIEYRLLDSHDSIKWVHEKGRGIFDEDGKLLYLDGVLFDVTVRKKIEEKNKHAEAELLQFKSVLDNTLDMIFMFEPESLRFTYVNQGALLSMGYSRAELLGMTPCQIKPLIPEPEFRQLIAPLIEGEQPSLRFDTVHRRKDGTDFPVAIFLQLVTQSDGSSQFVAIVHDITERKQSEEVIWQQANFDTLTGLPNRRMFLDRLEQEIKKSHRSGLPMALMLLDLDHFKEVNDTLGHAQGDLLLVEAARRIVECVRESDTVARLGGDEFTIILSELEDVNSVERIAQKIIERLAAPFQLLQETAFVSASVGITLYPDDAQNVDSLLKNADQAMYLAKKSGRNRFNYFTAALQEAAQTHLRLGNDLRSALAEQQFRVFYQPIVTLANGAIHKAEALLRWQHPTRGLISPAEFIPLAEETGMITDISDWVFREVANQAAHWRASHYPKFQISVNISPVQFRQKGTNFKAWLDYLQELSLPGQSIVLEITEGLLLDAQPSVIEQLRAFRVAGIRMSLDDFGTGFSSLSYLKKFNIDYLKIDQSFVRNMVDDAKDSTLCEAIIVMAHKLGLKVIAEGVETEQQRDLLASYGCDYGQGWLYSKAVPAEQFEDLLRGQVK